MNDMIKTYDDLIKLSTFESRLDYVMENSNVGEETFGPYRYLNQKFYQSGIWKKVRRDVIIRDRGCDLAFPGYEICGDIYVHHLNPITMYDVINLTPFAVDPKYLVTMSFNTHNFIHYGRKNVEPYYPVERTKNDTCPWRR